MKFRDVNLLFLESLSSFPDLDCVLHEISDLNFWLEIGILFKHNQTSSLQFKDLILFFLLDGTSEFIKGKVDSEPEGGIYSSGLQCALVLIGVFDIRTGEPVMGVINQPFTENTEDG